MSLLTLAITLAATIAHAARLDLSLQHMAYEANLKSVAVEKGTGGGYFIPYLERIAKCDECPICTAIDPIERALCLCINHDGSKKPALQNSEEAPRVKGKSGEHSGVIPYTECTKTCNSCACTKMWPPESNTCFCIDDSEPKQIADTVVQRAPIAVVAGAQLFPYDECNEKCKVVCACLPISPPPPYCSCFDPINSSTATAGGDDKQMVLDKMETMSYESY